APHARTYVDALRANGRTAAVWDVAERGAPDALGVLSHFRTVVHHTGANVPGVATQLQQRAFLNEGGKLVEAGERAGGSVDLGDGTPSDDFSQYYLGAYSRTSAPGATAFTGGGALSGFTGPLAGAPGYALDQAGSYMAAAVHTDDGYSRISRTVDLTGTTAAERSALPAQLLWDTEEGYDHVIVEARTAGGDDWTTLPESGGATSTDVPAECEAGFYAAGHPWLEHYLTVADDGCTATGSTGAWNSLTGSSGGWRQVEFDLAAYAGKKAEVSVSYVTDPGSGGRGVLADETSVVVGGTATGTEGFETSLGPWTVAGPPAGSPAVPKDWARTGTLFRTYAAVTTEDTVLLGFGLEHLTSAADRAALMRKALAALDA